LPIHACTHAFVFCIFVHAFKIIMYGSVFLISIFLHQDSKMWCVLLFFVFFSFFWCLFAWSNCGSVLLFFCFQDCWGFFFKFIFVYLHWALRTPSCFNCLHLQHRPILLHFNLAMNEILPWRLSMRFSHQVVTLVQCKFCVYHDHEELVDYKHHH
jgi:hypothetical protein